jgi:hypothetical protein
MNRMEECRKYDCGVNGISEQRLRREKRDYVVMQNTSQHPKGIIVNI